MSFDETLANAERAPDERPVRVTPTIPDEESMAPYWHGSATAHVERWRERALAAEAEVERLRAPRLRYRIRP